MPAAPQPHNRSPRNTVRGLFAFLVLAALLSGCAMRAGAAARRSVTDTPAPQPSETRVRPPTYTPASPEAAASPEGAASPEAAEPGATVAPENTPAAASTALPEATSAPISDPVLEKVKLVGLSWLEKYKYNLLLSFDFPGPVDPADYRVTLEGKEYHCEVLEQYPNRLYCNGQGAKVLAVALVQIYPAGADQPGFEQEVWVPYFQ